MGGVAVLQPQDYPLPRVKVYPPHMKSRRRNPNSVPNSTILNPKKRSPTRFGNNNHTATTATAPKVANQPVKNIVMGQVKILKRGEVLKGAGAAAAATTLTKDRISAGGDEIMTAGGFDDLVLSSTDRLGPEPEMVPKHITLGDFYAGSAFFTSPPPSSVPLPAFFNKKVVLSETDDATTDLRRILRLDLS